MTDYPINIKKALSEDLKDLRQISVQTFKESFADQNGQEDMKIYLRENLSEKQLLCELNNPDSVFYLVRIKDDVVGYLKLNIGSAQTELKDDKTLEVERIYVLENYTGFGIGQQLLKLAIDVAHQAKKQYIWLGVWENNVGAIRFYKKNGFLQFDKHIFKLGKDLQTDLLMKLELNQPSDL